MNSTLYNGYSGIKTHQFGLDSTSNNIANINTNGYRANMPEFKSLFATALGGLHSTKSVSSDMNYGATKGSNAISNADGSYKESDGEFSVAYAGKGWFVVGDNENERFALESRNGVYFTRDGSFSRDAEGYLVNSAGYYMLGVDLGKVKDGIFINDSANDEANLALNELKPLQIPKDLHYGPTETTSVSLAVNLNANRAEIATHKAFSDSQGAIDEARLWESDINALVVDSENINAPVYSDGIARIALKSGEVREISLQYGELKTLGDLRENLSQNGLVLDFVRESDGSVNKNLILELKSSALDASEITLDGKLFNRLGLKGTKKATALNIPKYEESKTYAQNDLINFSGAIFKKIDSSDGANLFSDSWVLLDSSAVREFSENGNFAINDLAQIEGRIYQKIAESSESPNADSSAWREVGEAKSLEIRDFSEGENYARNDFVRFNNRVYQKLSDEASSLNPSEDAKNYKLAQGESFLSAKINIANYKTTTEIFNDSGEKLAIISQYVLRENAPNRQVWDVRSAIYDKSGEVALSALIPHSISFDNDGNADGELITLQYGEKEVSYNITGSANRKSANLAYIDSSVLDSSKDGAKAGELANIGIDNNGIINLSFSNGVTEKFGRVGIVAFVNDQGLQKVGGNLFEMSGFNGETPASGVPLSGWDENGNLRFGQVLHKYLETSNVNPADAMTDLIIYQRGYAMNAKAFTTGDDLIREAINLKR